MKARKIESWREARKAKESRRETNKEKRESRKGGGRRKAMKMRGNSDDLTIKQSQVVRKKRTPGSLLL